MMISERGGDRDTAPAIEATTVAAGAGWDHAGGLRPMQIGGGDGAA